MNKLSQDEVTQTIVPDPVSQELVNRIEAMDVQLKKEFGYDYSFSIKGNGRIVAASNFRDGIVKPRS